MERSKELQTGYTILGLELEHLARLFPQDENVLALILFGSVARLAPHHASDVDLLVLCQTPEQFFSQGERLGASLLIEAMQGREVWGLSPLVSDQQGSDLTEALLANIAQDGVLVYQQAGFKLPPALAYLQPYDHWYARIRQALERRPEPARRTRPA